MGTRGFLGFVIDGAEKITYNHFDSYPEGLGNDVRDWLSTVDLAQAADSARMLRVVDPDSVPTAEEKEALQQYADAHVGSQRLDDWYVLLRHTQGEPALILAAGVMGDSAEFPLNSLFAEWGYIVDFDSQMFEVYKGFQHEPHEEGRFASRTGDGMHEGYYPCRLIAQWPLSQIPSEEEFLADIAAAVKE